MTCVLAVPGFRPGTRAIGGSDDGRAISGQLPPWPEELDGGTVGTSRLALVDEGHTVLGVVDVFAVLRHESYLFHRIHVTQEHRELQRFAEAAHGIVHFTPSLLVPHVVGDQPATPCHRVRKGS